MNRLTHLIAILWVAHWSAHWLSPSTCHGMAFPNPLNVIEVLKGGDKYPVCYQEEKFTGSMRFEDRHEAIQFLDLCEPCNRRIPLHLGEVCCTEPVLETALE